MRSAHYQVLITSLHKKYTYQETVSFSCRLTCVSRCVRSTKTSVFDMLQLVVSDYGELNLSALCRSKWIVFSVLVSFSCDVM